MSLHDTPTTRSSALWADCRVSYGHDGRGPVRCAGLAAARGRADAGVGRSRTPPRRATAMTCTAYRFGVKRRTGRRPAGWACPPAGLACGACCRFGYLCGCLLKSAPWTIRSIPLRLGISISPGPVRSAGRSTRSSGFMTADLSSVIGTWPRRSAATPYALGSKAVPEGTSDARRARSSRYCRFVIQVNGQQ